MDPSGDRASKRTQVMLAKFPQRHSVPALERAIVLGLALFDDNNLQLLLDRISGSLAGHVSAP
jgi:hypothetical protein